MEGLLVAGIGILGAIYAADRWIKSGSAPPTSLRCNHCPKLTAEARRYKLLAAVLGVAFVAAVMWGVAR